MQNTAFNAANKIIERLQDPEMQQDAATKMYVDSKLSDSKGFKLTDDGHYDISNNRLCNVADPKDDADAINRQTLGKVLNLSGAVFRGYEDKQVLDNNTKLIDAIFNVYKEINPIKN